MNKLDLDYQALLQDILDNGVTKSDRTGTGTLSVFGRQIRHKMSEGFPLLTTKKMHWKSIVAELLWFLRGDTNIKYLLDNDCHIWDGDAYMRYLIEDAKYMTRGSIENWKERGFHLSKEEFIERIKTDSEFAAKWGELGPIYGKQWRSWNHFISTGDPIIESVESEDSIAVSVTPQGIECEIDQIKNLIKDLKTNPDSRRLMVTAWNPGEIEAAVLPPCHYGFQVYTRELNSQERKDLYDKTNYTKDIFPTDENGWKGLFDGYHIPTRAISLMYNARSQDVPLGTPFNIASYALLLEIIAKMVNMVPDELITNMGDCHIYLNQIDGVKEQLTREPYELPKLVISNQVNFNEGVDEFLNSCSISDFQIEGYQSHPTIKIPLSN